MEATLLQYQRADPVAPRKVGSQKGKQERSEGKIGGREERQGELWGTSHLLRIGSEVLGGSVTHGRIQECLFGCSGLRSGGDALDGGHWPGNL